MDHFNFFLSHGLWSVVEALFNAPERIVKEDDKLSMEKLILEIATHPSQSRISCPTFGKPWQLSWLASSFIYKLISLNSQELRSLKWFSDQNLSRADIDKLKKVSEMHGLMYSLPVLVSFELKNELIQLYVGIISVDRSKTQTSVLSVSNPRGISLNALDYIRQCLLQNPVKTNPVIQRLLCLWSYHFTQSDGMLQDVYERVFIDLLSSFNSESEEDNCKMLSLLTIFGASEEKEKMIVRNVFPKLLDLCYSQKINLAQVYLSLVGRGKFGLLRVLVGLEAGNQLWKFSKGEEGVSPEAILRKLVDDGQINLRNIFLRAHRRSVPWVDDVVELCVHAITSGDINSVKACLSNSGLKKLWPLVCYGVWDHFMKHRKFAEEDLYTIMEECKKSADDKEYLLQMSQLEGCMRFSDWIVKSGSAKKESLASVVETVISSCCAVHALKQAARLEDLTEEAVMEALQLFRSGHSSEPSYKLMVQTEISTCRGYYVVMSVYKAILSSVEIEHLVETASPQSEGVSRSQYEEMVKNKFTSVKNSLSQLHPLSFRVDILEYIFSLLFLKHKDIHEENTSDSGGEDSDTVVEDTSSFDTSRSDRTGLSEETTSVSFSSSKENLHRAPHAPQPVDKQAVRKSLKQQHRRKGLGGCDTRSSLAPGHYVCGAQVVRDLLQCLKDCVVDASVALFGLLATVETDDGATGEGSAFPTSVASAQEVLQKRLARLSHVVGEAACRLEIVTSDGKGASSLWYPIWHELPTTATSGIIPIRVYRSWSEDDSEDERNVEGQRASSTTSYQGVPSGEARRKKSRSENEKSSESGSNATGGACSEGGSSSRRRRRRVTWRRSSSSSGGPGPARARAVHQGKALRIVERMLASPRSLVVQCLAQGEIVKAQKVIKLFKLEGSILALEVRFLEEYVSLLHKLDKKTKEGKLIIDSSASTLRKSPLQSVKHAASAGMHSISFSSLVEAFLTAVRPPVVEGLEAVLLDDPDPVSPCLSEMLTVEGRHSLRGYAYTAAILIDLTTTFPGMVEQSTSLADITLKRCPGKRMSSSSSGGEEGSSAQGRSPLSRSPKYQLVPPVASAPQMAGPLGPPSFLHSIVLTLKVVNDRCFRDGSAGLWSLVDGALFSLCRERLSVPDLLATLLPLCPDALVGCLSFWEDLHEGLSEFRQVFAKVCEVGSDGDSIGTSTSHASDLEARKRTTLKDLHSSKVNGAFNKIIAVCRSMPCHLEGMSHRDRGKRHSGPRDPQYLQMLFTYLKMISSVMVQSSLQAKGFATPASYFDVLSEDIGSIVGKLVFECDVPPSRLESMASKMNLDLVSCITHNCCPAIESATPPLECMELYKTETVELGKWGRVVLNPVPKDWHGPARAPGPLVESLLSALLDALHACDSQCCGSLSLGQLGGASQEPSIAALLEEGARELALVDLDLLHPGDDTLVFLANLASLLTLHGVLTLEVSSGEAFGLLSSHASECLLARMSLCYLVSSLGAVSLHDLTRSVLGEQLSLALCDPSSWSDGHSGNSKVLVSLGAWPLPSLLPHSTQPCPGLLFAVATGRAWCPKATVLHASTPLDAQLQDLIADYLNIHVTFGPEGLSDSLTVPQLVCLYHCAMENDSSSSTSHKLEQSEQGTVSLCNRLLKFLAEHSTGQLKQDLTEILERFGPGSEQELTLKVTAPSCSPRITLENSVDEGAAYCVQSRSLPSASEWCWSGGPLPSTVLEYLELRCWPLAIVAAMANSPGPTVVLPPLMPHATSFKHLLQGALEYPEMADSGDVMAAALSPEGLPSARLWAILDALFLSPDRAPPESTLALLRMIPQPRLHREPKLATFHDLVMWDVSSREPSEGIEEPWRYGVQIRDPAVRVACVLCNINAWASSKEGACREALLSLCGNKAIDVPPAAKAQVLDTLRKVEVYEKVFAHVKSAVVKNWYDVHQLLKNDPGAVLQRLIQAKQMPLFLKWMELHDLSEEALIALIDPCVLVNLLDAEPPDFQLAKKLLRLLPLDHAAHVCQGSLPHLSSTPCLRFVLSFLLEPCRSALSEEEACGYEQWALGLIMVSHRLLLGSGTGAGRSKRQRSSAASGGGTKGQHEVHRAWSWLDLAPHPMLILEQLLMNVQLEALEGALALAKPHLRPHNSPKHQGISLDDVDALLRQYATKALDFRVCSISQVQRDEASSKPHSPGPPPSFNMSASVSSLSLFTSPGDSRVLESLSSGSLHSLDLARMPAKVPTKAEWVPNDEVTVCMCCQLVSFSMFNRRHHCRRCGRVVCWVCSTHRLKVEGYLGVPVRVCDDCYSAMHQQKVAGYGDVSVRVCNSCHGQTCESSRGEGGAGGGEEEEEGEEVDEEGGKGAMLGGCSWWWRLSGDRGQDATLREEFAFEQAPSASLCLAILAHHSPGGPSHPRLLIESAERLLSHLRPSTASAHPTLNPEVDHALLIQMVRSLAVASKVLYSRIGVNTGIERCDRVIGRAGLLNLLVRSGWAGAGEWAGALLAPQESGGPPSAGSEEGGGGVVRSGSMGRRPPCRGLPSLRDRLVKEEQWELALEVATKGGLGRAAIWAAWGKACLRVGGWKRARSLFSRCLHRAPSSVGSTKIPSVAATPSSSSSPACHLSEILQILEESSASLPIPLEDAPNRVSQPYPSVLESLSSLDAIAKGIILLPALGDRERPVWSGPPLLEDVREECLYYLRSYGSDGMTLDFHLRHGEIKEALLHFLNKRMDPEAFLDSVYLHCFRKGWITHLESEMRGVDPYLERWKPHLCCMCRLLERRGMLQVLYKVQVFAEDNVRAAMTCIRFYCKDVSSYSQMRQNCVHLRNAQRHMEDELSKGGWVEGASSLSSSAGSRISPGRKTSVGSLGRRKASESSVLPLKMDPRDVDRHINTIRRQDEVAKFLGVCEASGKNVAAIAAKVASAAGGSGLPMLFGGVAERVQVAVLTIVCGKNVEEGFGVAFRVIQDYNLRAASVFEVAGQVLVSEGRPRDLVHLISCIQSSGVSDCEDVCDQVASACIQAMVKLWEVGWEEAEVALDDEASPPDDNPSMTSSMERSGGKGALSLLVDPLLKVIFNPVAKMSAYIACGQLKNAYLIAVKLNSNQDVERIAQEAERLGQSAILRICLRRLEMVKGSEGSSSQPPP